MSADIIVLPTVRVERLRTSVMVKLTVEVPPDIVDTLLAVAVRDGCSAQDVASEILIEAVLREEK